MVCDGALYLLSALNESLFEQVNAAEIEGAVLHQIPSPILPLGSARWIEVSRLQSCSICSNVRLQGAG